MAFDPDAFLGKKDDKEAEPEKEKGFDVDAFLKAGNKEEAAVQTVPSAEPEQTAGPIAPSEGALVGAVAPAVMGYGMGPTGMKELGQAVKAGVSPYIQGAKEALTTTANIYKTRPLVAPLIDAAGLATIGFPPIAGGQQALGAYDKYNAVKQGAQAAGQVLSQGAPTTSPVQNIPTTATKAPYMDMVRSAGPEVGQKISELYGAQSGGGGNNAVRSWLNSAEGRAAQAANPQFAQQAQQYLKSVPGMGAQVMKTVSPFLKVAAKVAGPVGMAANLYEAAPYMEQAGPELASGAAQNRMAQAQRMILDRPTPAPIRPAEASNLLASGDERTINIYGGRSRLQEIISAGIKQKAFGKILNTAGPGQ